MVECIKKPQMDFVIFCRLQGSHFLYHMRFCGDYYFLLNGFKWMFLISADFLGYNAVDLYIFDGPILFDFILLLTDIGLLFWETSKNEP